MTQHQQKHDEVVKYFKLLVLWQYAMVMGFGIFRTCIDFILALVGFQKSNMPRPTKGYASLFTGFDNFWTTWCYGRLCECWNRPITGVPGTYIDVLERKSVDEKVTFTLTGEKIKSLNLGSYNYLGFANKEGPVLEDAVASLTNFSTSNSGSFHEGAYTSVHKELEECIAEFVGQEAAVIFEMGFATNSTTLPALIKKGGLIISDSLNHASLVIGCRSSGAQIRTFKHNDLKDLEKVIRKAIVQGQPGTGQPWSMILLLVEGIYSMEGELCDLPGLVNLKKKYKIYLYVDEAHSIGAIGPKGRGVCDYYGVNPQDIDILMGTFTKSFGSIGGYISGKKDLIDYLRVNAFGCIYSTSMSAACAQQALSSLRVIMGRDGTDTGKQKLMQLRENSNYCRTRLTEMGFIILGNDDSPIIPIMLYSPTVYAMFSNYLLERGVAVVVVSYPATAITEGRARLCLSAGHKIEDLEWALKHISDVGDLCGVKFCKQSKLSSSSLPSSSFPSNVIPSSSNTASSPASSFNKLENEIVDAIKETDTRVAGVSSC